MFLIILCMAYIIWFLWTRQEDIKLSFQIDYLRLSSIALFCILNLLVSAFRFKLVLELNSGRPLPYAKWLRFFIVGRFLNQFFPQLGNAYKSIMLKASFNISYTQYISSFVSFNWMDTIFNFLITAAVLIVVEPDFQLFNINGALFILSFLLLIITVPIAVRIVLQTMRIKRPQIAWLILKLTEVFKTSLSNLTNMRYLICFIILGLISFIITACLFHFIFSGIGISAELPQLVFFYTLHKISSLINITPSNLGVRELAYGILSAEAGYGMVYGIMVSAILRVSNFIMLTIIGLYLGGASIVKNRLKYASIIKDKPESTSNVSIDPTRHLLR